MVNSRSATQEFEITNSVSLVYICGDPVPPERFCNRATIMSVDSIAKVLEAITHLLGVTLWPAIFVFILVRFRTGIANFISTLGEFSFKAAGVEATAKVKAEAAASLAAATASRPEAAASPEKTLQEARNAAQIVVDAITPNVIRRAERSTVLWVDDRPDNNLHERSALEVVGISFVLSTSTEDALDQIRRQSFDSS